MRNNKGNLNCKLLEIFSLNVQYYRKVAGLSQFELGTISGYAHNFINDIENKKKGASFETVENIAKALNIVPFFLFIDPKDRISGENHMFFQERAKNGVRHSARPGLEKSTRGEYQRAKSK